jgi:ribosomal protein L29
MKYKELKDKEAPALSALLKEKREAVRKSRFVLAGSGTRNVKEQKANKKDIARILTLQTSRATTNHR